MSAIYNEIEPYAASWLANLSDAGHIARGVVNVRSIRDLRADDVVGAAQFHTFAGLGAWSYALRLAGWPDDRPVWTGSCPCQPFSVAGKGGGTADERHLWPEWFRLIRECRPPIVFGEQVASGAGLAWFDAVRADLEAAGYAVGAADLCAAGVGAPHIRQRLFFGAVRMADAERVDGRREHGHGVGDAARGDQGDGDQRQRLWAHSADGGGAGDVADARGKGRQQVGTNDGWRRARSAAEGVDERPLHGRTRDVADTGGARLPARQRGALLGAGRRGEGGAVEQRDGASTRGLADADGGERGDKDAQRGRQHGLIQADGGPVRGALRGSEQGPLAGTWDAPDWLFCRDGKARPVEPGTFPLAHGAPARVGRLRAYGNAIVPQVAAAFVRAFMEATT